MREERRGVKDAWRVRERENTHKERKRENKIGKSGHWQKQKEIDQKNRQITFIEGKSVTKNI